MIQNIKSSLWELPKFVFQKRSEILSPYPLFLTSANHSGEREAHTLEDAKSIVHDSNIEMQSFNGGICDKPGSNIFEFMKWSNEKIYLRRNYF
jgi:tRNA A37 threonylcarbamoyladenosine synthetase subunit TsaC/SUA5/YrdC